MAEAKFNDRCFIGLPACGYAFSSTRMAFIAAPSHDDVQLEVDLLKSIVEERGIECYVALRNREPAKLAFCTKICSKIITSQFCIALLTACPDSKALGATVANPNVHMEYGLMLALNKYVIPLQLDGDTLAFNIQPLDTVKYTRSNFKRIAGEAIDEAILRTSRTELPSSAQPITPLLLKYLTVRGLNVSDINRPDSMYWYRLGSPVGFMLMDGPSFVYFGVFDNETSREVVFRTKLLLQNLNQALTKFTASHATLTYEVSEHVRGVFNNLQVEILIADALDANVISGKVEELTKGYAPFPWKLLKRNDLQAVIDAEYNAIGDV